MAFGLDDERVTRRAIVLRTLQSRRMLAASSLRAYTYWPEGCTGAANECGVATQASDMRVPSCPRGSARW
eukprot:2460668-Prymnesium_polylepis.1